MLITLLLLLAATVGGFALSYLADDDAPFSWRVAAGNVIGSVLMGTALFVFSLAFGLNIPTVLMSVVVILLPAALLYKPENKKRFRNDWLRAKSRMQGSGRQRFLRLAHYIFFFLLFFFFFDRAMLETAAGIFTGGSQNFGDLPFHLGAIFSFSDANNFPPENPSFAGARFSYPFIADLLTAGAVKLGGGARNAMFVQNLVWAFSLLILLERFVLQLTDNRLAARIAPWLLFFSGGLGFVWFLSDYSAQTKGFFDFLWHLPKDYTISDQFRWGNSMVVLFMTQRSLLLGLPLTLIVLWYLWKAFTADSPAAPSRVPFAWSPLLVGMIAGTLPLVHLHSLVVLFVVGLSLLILKPERWATWASFAAGVGVIAVPELLWSMAGSASETSKFFEWHFGWDKGDKNFVWFWFTNTGLLIPILLAGLYLVSLPRTDPDAVKSDKKRKKAKAVPVTANPSSLGPYHPSLWFYLPFAFLFLVSNTAKLAPWQWDNIKVLIYWFVGSLPFVALAIAWLWQKQNAALKVIAATCFFVLIASGALDVWRTVSGQIEYKVFDTDAVEIANQIRLRTPADSLFLNAPTFNTTVVLTGRQSLMRYPGHLSSHGIDYQERESDVKSIYRGGPDAVGLIERNDIDYVLVSPEERNLGPVNEQFFSRYQVVAEAGQYRVYKVR